MTGDQVDIITRMRAVLPARWFPDTAPILDSLLAGIGAVWAIIYQQLEFVAAQARIGTAAGLFLDLIAADYFGTKLRRQAGQSDDSLRTKILKEILRERTTREALRTSLSDVTGRDPIIFEFSRPADTRAWGMACGWGTAGGWGSLDMPFQCLVTAFRPLSGGVAVLDGWGETAGGWGGGAIGYASFSMIGGQISDDQIEAAVVGVMPAATTAWLQISN
ncbi:MAG: hypothetical protein P4K98_06310 [Bryobacteraceae bacterium]|nr:hypothetical protein [Bryobacteraceae bacterium]